MSRLGTILVDDIEWPVILKKDKLSVFSFIGDPTTSLVYFGANEWVVKKVEEELFFGKLVTLLILDVSYKERMEEHVIFFEVDHWNGLVEVERAPVQMVPF